MRHEALAVVEALGAVEAALHREPEEAVDVERGGVHDALVADEALGHVAAEPHGQAVLELRHGKLLQALDRQVEVAHAAGLDHVAEAVDRVGVAEGLVDRGRGDDAHVVVDRHGDDLVEELLRRVGAGEHELVVLVAQADVELHGGLAQAGDEQACDLAHHLLLHGAQVVGADAGLVALAQALGGSAQVAGEVGVHVARVGRAGRLGHGLLGHHAVLAHEGTEHVPLAAVGDGVREQVRHEAAGQRLVERVEDVLEEPVALLDLVEEQGVGLRELEGLEVVAVDDAGAHGVEAREHPAAARALLVAALALADLDVKGAGVGGDGLRHAGDLADALRGDGVLGDDVGALLDELRAHCAEVLEGDRLHLVHVSSCLPAGPGSGFRRKTG